MFEYYNGLFRICGFQHGEIEKERPRIERVLAKIGIGSEDIPLVEQRLREQHEVELEGVKKILRVWILELLDLVLAKEEGKRVIYYGYPTIQGPGMAMQVESAGDLYVGCPDVVLCHTVGLVFDKLTPLLEAAEAGGLPPGHALCSLQQIRNGALALDIIPVPDLVIGSSYYCDMGSKADELLHEMYGHPAVYADGSMDSRWGEYPKYEPQRIKYLGEQLDKLFTVVKDILGIEVTQQSMMKAMTTSRQLYSALGQLASLMMADPIPISGMVSGMAMNLTAASTSRSMTEGPAALNTLCQEVKERVESGYGIMEKGAPRVMNFAHSFNNAGITHMIEKAGLALVASFVTVPPRKRDKSLIFNTLGEELAEAAMRGGAYHSTYAFVKRFAEAAQTLEMDGVIWGYQYNCRPWAIGSHLFKQVIEEETGIPTLSLEMDYYETRSYGAERLRIKVEAFAEILRARKAATSN